MQDISVLYLSQITVLAGTGHRAHTHDYWHFALRLPDLPEGTERDGGRYCSCFPAGKLNKDNVCTKKTRSINVMFLVHNEELARKLAQLPFHHLTREELHIPLLLDIVGQARDLEPGQEFIDFAFGYYLHLLLASRAAMEETASPVGLTEKALRFIEQNYMNQIRLEDVAEHIGRSTYHTSRLVKAETGMTVVEHVREVRIKNACRLLAYSDISMEQVMAQCGFLSDSYFHKVFREKVGTTPNRYRTSHSVSDTFYRGEDGALDVPYEEPVFTYVPGARKCIHWRTPREYFTQTIQS